MSSSPALSIVDHDQPVHEGIAGPALVTREKRAKPAEQALSEIAFGPYRLLPTQFLLLEGDRSVPLGSRALEILIALLERPGELVTKQELMDRVWPNVFVEPANLTVHISALRRTLRDGPRRESVHYQYSRTRLPLRCLGRGIGTRELSARHCLAPRT